MLGQLRELTGLRHLIADYEARLQREQDLHAMDLQNAQREADLNAKAIAICERETAVARSERDLAQSQAAFWEQAYKTITKKPSLGCRIWRVLSFGTHSCY